MLTLDDTDSYSGPISYVLEISENILILNQQRLDFISLTSANPIYIVVNVTDDDGNAIQGSAWSNCPAPTWTVNASVNAYCGYNLTGPNFYQVYDFLIIWNYGTVDMYNITINTTDLML